jgi:hypothetical protein
MVLEFLKSDMAASSSYGVYVETLYMLFNDAVPNCLAPFVYFPFGAE